MHMGQTADLSPYRVFKASSAIEAGAFKAVTLGEDGVAIAGESDVPTGLLTAETGDVATGEEVNVQVFGGGLWLAGEELKQGDLLSAGEGGKALKATSGKYVFAIALEAASENEVTAVNIINGGVKS